MTMKTSAARITVVKVILSLRFNSSRLSQPGRLNERQGTAVPAHSPPRSLSRELSIRVADADGGEWARHGACGRGTLRLSEPPWWQQLRNADAGAARQHLRPGRRKSQAYDLGQSTFVNQSRSLRHVKPPNFPLAPLRPVVELLHYPKLENLDLD